MSQITLIKEYIFRTNEIQQGGRRQEERKISTVIPSLQSHCLIVDNWQ